MVASPCVNVCVMDEANGLCSGCYRTLDEVARWSVMNDREKRKVVASLAHRKTPKRGQTPFSLGSDPFLGRESLRSSKRGSDPEKGV
jgi:predicted Fe-S protein YdhL (DUF1289 family)